MALFPSGEEGISVLKQALFFHQSLGMKVFLYRILNKPSLYKEFFYAGKVKQERAKALENMRNTAKQIVPKDLLEQFTYRVKHGNKLQTLLRQSKRGGYEFLIVLKDGTKDCLDYYEINKLISRSDIPIMNISKEHMSNEIKHIVIPVDVSQTTKKKLLWASYFAKKYGAKITIVSALNYNIDLKQSLAWRNSEKLKHMLSQREIDCEVVIIKEKVREKHEVILDYIKQVNPGLVIIRTHQESAMKNTHIGNFVSNLVHGIKIPVFTVNQFQSPMPIDFEI